MATTNSPEQIPMSNSFFLFNGNQTDQLLYTNPNKVVGSNVYNSNSSLKSDSGLFNQLDYSSYSFSPNSSFHSTMSNNDMTNGTLVDNEDLNQLTITNMDEDLKNMLKQVSMNLNNSSNNISNSSRYSSFHDHLNSSQLDMNANKLTDSYKQFNQHNQQQNQNANSLFPQHQPQTSHQSHHYLNNDEFEFFKYLESKNEPDNLFRRRINSCSNVEPMSQINMNMLSNLLQLYNNSNNNNTSNTSINDSMSSAEQQYAEMNAHRNLRHNSVIGMTSTASTANNSNPNQPIERENRAYSFSNLPIHNKTASPNSVGCLNSNCLLALTNKNESHFDQNLVKFSCNLCQNARYMHRVCYDKVCLDQLNSCNFKRNNHRQMNEGLESNKKHDPERTVVKIQCTNCSAGYLLLNNQSRYNNDKSFGNEMNVRKKSFCLNNPPVPVPMQPVHESRSPSPKTIFNNMASGSKYLTKRQSAPVNMPKNRNRTMSNGSTGSFSASSSFSSSMGTSFTIGSPNANNLAFKKSIQSHQTPINGTFNNSNNSYYQINQANQINEVNLKLDAECLNNMLKTMADKLKINDLEKFEEKIANTGNIFYQRDDWEVFKRIPLENLNSFHVRIEDEGPFGNDDVRWFLLSYFSKLCIREMRCVLCDCELLIYDKFPLVDGTLFVSPVKYEEKDKNNNIINPKKNNEFPLQCVPANISNKNQFIYAICLNCIHHSNSQIKCKSCSQSWKGAVSLQLGTMYKYEIFAAFPCCQKRLNCSHCDASIVNLERTGGLDNFSSYSEEVECPECKVKDFHFIKPLKQFYDISIPKKE